jgi:hypothetical protein
LTLTTTLGYNSNGYLTTDNLSHQGNPYSGALASDVTYQNNNLINLIQEQGMADQEAVYDSVGRLICFNSNRQPADAYLEYDGSGRRIHRYWNFYGYPSCAQIIANPTGVSPLYKVSTYTYSGNELVSELAISGYNGGGPTSFYSRTLSYDGEGNLTQMNQIDYDQHIRAPCPIVGSRVTIT